MSRSVKDLRELINISRLSFHGDESVCKSDEQGKKVAEHDSSTEETDRERTSLRGVRDIRFKPLPAIKSSKATKDHTLNRTIIKENVELTYEKSCNCILEHIDGSVVSSWLHRSNESLQWLSTWVSTKEYFVRFAKFWLAEMDQRKQSELVELEVGIILDEITFSVQDGMKRNQVSKEDVMSFFLLIVWEYPSKTCGPQSSVFVLNTLVTLASARKDKYRKLLSNVKFTTKSPEQIHWILSVRAFALISIVTALVRFFSSLKGYCLSNQDVSKAVEHGSKMIEDYAFDAVWLGYLDILVYLVEKQGLDISGLKNCNDNSSLLFCAVTCNQMEITKYILGTDKGMDMKQTSKSGNSLLHAAVNTGNPSIVALLLNVGAHVNQPNMECDNVTPIHLAIMQDSPEIVQLLIHAGARTNLSCPSESASPLQLAEDLQRLHILKIIKGDVLNDE